jgi:phospholipid/cholesterol/gamma-HCH transport system substrate-binding protein
MKSFTERNPYIIGVLVIAFIALGTASALLLNGGFFKSQYKIYSDFHDAAGITPNSRVKVAGFDVGTVGSVKAHGSMVRVELKIDKGTKLPDDTRAAIAVDTLLGSKSVNLTTGTDWQHLLRSKALIPCTATVCHTSTPIDLLDLQDISTPLLQKSDANALNQLMSRLSAVTEGKHTDVQQILNGLTKLTTVVNSRQGEARDLITSAKTLSTTLANRDQDLIGAVQNLDRIVTVLVDRRNELAGLLSSTADATQRLTKLIHENRPQLDNVLDEVHSDLVILSRHQGDLAQSLSLLSTAIKGFSSVGYSGPNDYPNHWANIYAQLLGPADPDAIYGACGLVDRALDLALGNDPLPCNQRTGPEPGSVTGNATTGATTAQINGTHVPLSAAFGPLLSR